MAWEKGESGNPEGRPAGVPNKTSRELAQLARTFTVEAIERLAEIMRGGPVYMDVQKEDGTTARVPVGAIKESDSIKAIQILFERGYGRVPETIKLTVEKTETRYYVDKPRDETMGQWMKRTAALRGDDAELH